MGLCRINKIKENKYLMLFFYYLVTGSIIVINWRTVNVILFLIHASTNMASHTFVILTLHTNQEK
jgi:hypothetical protein